LILWQHFKKRTVKMRKIQTLNKISSKGLDLFPRDAYEVASEFSAPDAIVLRSFKMHDMELPSSLKAIARAGAGTNNIPIDRCTEQGIVVFNTPGANANAVKELVLTGMLLASRDIIGGVNWVQSIADKGDEVAKLVEKGKSNFGGNELKGKRLGIIGLGAIGAMVANTALELGMEVVGYDPYLSVEAAWELSSEVEKATGLETLLADVDFISIHVPLLESTKHMFNSEKFAMMKDGVSIMNFARGGLVHDADMKSAIDAGKVRCYVTDFPDVNVLGVKGIIPIPHLGASTEESEENCATMAVKQVKDYLENGNIRNSVNFPNCVLPRGNCDHRITIKNHNVPNIIGEVSTTLAKNSINICDMLNKSKGDIAFNIMELSGALSEAVVGELEAIEGVISVRLI
jgi:D-3-phosphoglycerate dehydrogenase